MISHAVLIVSFLLGIVIVFHNILTSRTAGMPEQNRLPVYFLSIGGPNFIENTVHPAYDALRNIGHEITQKVKPRAVVVLSAHWTGEPGVININAAENADIIYDFYNFPRRYYEVKYPNKGSPPIAEKTTQLLDRAGFSTRKVERGLDHGIWTGFLAAFNPQSNPLNVPIVQISLPYGDEPMEHWRLGQALSPLRDEGILIVAAGMAVHNLLDFRRTRGLGGIMPYVGAFDEALKYATTGPPEDRRSRLVALATNEELFAQAHPTPEHILPIYVAAGAAGSDSAEQVWTFLEGSLSWAQYRFGVVPNGLT